MSFRKDDGEKPRLDLLPPSALMAVGRVLTFGALKYEDNNWRRAPKDPGKGRYIAALLRHVLAYMLGEKNDPESGEPHMAHAACCALFILDLDETEWGPPEGEDA